MKFKAILAKTTTDMMKSKIRSEYLAEVVLECYITPSEFAKLIEDYNDKEFGVKIVSKHEEKDHKKAN